MRKRLEGLIGRVERRCAEGSTALPRHALVLLLCILGWAASAAAAIPAAERTVLTNFYTSTNGPSWTNKTGWNGGAGTECTWVGITCDAANSHVIGIGFYANNLSGPLPALGGLTALQYFFVVNDHLTGPIPSLAGLTALKEFLVWSNNLTGSIPSLAGLPALQKFEVSHNNLSGPVPAAPATLLAGWSGLCGNNLVSTGNPTVDAGWIAPAGYWLGCQKTVTTAKPTCTLTASPSTIPAGSSTQLTVSCSPAAASIDWGNAGFSSTVTSGTVSPSVTTTYYARGINAAGLGNPVDATVTVTPAPSTLPVCTLTATPATIASGGPSILNASCTPAAPSYIWTGGTCAGTIASSCTVTPVATTTYTVRGSNAGGAGTAASATVTVGSASAAQVVEFYNTILDNYFITADAAEAAAIDSGSAGPGWSRTGNTFASGGSTAVCRFYGSQSPGPNSHFYTAIASECAGLKALQAITPPTQKRWNFEGLDFMTTAPLLPTSGGNLYCPGGLVSIYRAYNNGAARGVDSNHRITSNLTSIQAVLAQGWVSEDIVMCAPSGANGVANGSRVPDTGQTKCYNPAGSEITCGGTGQDGAYSFNPMSFQDNGNGTISDMVTGLIWQKQDDGKRYTWFEASGTFDAVHNPSSQNICGSITLGGRSGWRLPTVRELISIVDFSIPDPGPRIDTRYFPKSSGYYFWSSSPYLAPSTYPAVWIMNLHTGSSDYQTKSLTEYVRCVHGSLPPAPSLTDNGNGTITDTISGLTWQQGEPGKMAWAAALSYCESLSLGGRTDWRLPNIKELESLTDRSRYNPAVDMSSFPGVSLDSLDYWSSTSELSAPDNANYIMFHNGTDNYGPKSDFSDYRVRCVRSGQ